MNLELTCPYCSYSKKVPKEKIPAGARWVTCPLCKQRFEMPLSFLEDSLYAKGMDNEPNQQTNRASDIKTARTGTPWEQRSELGLWQGLCQTMKGVLFSPENLFNSMPHKGGFIEPLAFGLLFGSLGSMFALFWQVFFLSTRLRSMLGDFNLGHLTLGILFAVTIILIPFFVVLGMFLWSAIWHLLLLIVGGANKGYEATFRVVAYSRATQIWLLIPFIGGVICWIWQLVVQIIGFRNTHETSYARVVFALIIIVAFFIFLFFVFFLFLFATIGRQLLGQL